MAASDLFEATLNQLSSNERERVKDFVSSQRKEMFAARSEDARTRIVHDFIKELHARLTKN